MLVTNEGNADLTVTLPPVHIALFGVDKVVASLDDAVAVLRMLPRSGTGQIMTSYVNWITGPSRSADIEQSLTIGVHGPREMHCVILDNGREEMRADPVFSDALTCIRCGACSNACPAFMAVGGHQFGHIYNGPIGLVLTPFHHGLDEADLPNTLCTQCNACQEICPVDIPLPRQILEHRRKGRKSLRKKAVLEVWKRPELADRLLRTGAPFSGLVPGTPRLARVPYRDRAPVNGSGEGEPLTIFASCMVDRMLPESAVALQRIAEAAGYNVGFPKAQWCCGLISANAGDFHSADELNTKLADSLRDSKGLIVTPSASCFGAFTIDALDWGAQIDVGLRDRFRDSTRFALQLLAEHPDLVRTDQMSLKVQPRVAAGGRSPCRLEAGCDREDRLHCSCLRQPGLPHAHRRRGSQARHGSAGGARGRAGCGAPGLGATDHTEERVDLCTATHFAEGALRTEWHSSRRSTRRPTSAASTSPSWRSSPPRSAPFSSNRRPGPAAISLQTSGWSS
jgi:Fe-S oxidoreductase